MKNSLLFSCKKTSKIEKKKIRQPHPLTWKKREYRCQVSAGDLATFEVRIRETDLLILGTQSCPGLVRDLVIALRGQIEAYISRFPEFLSSLSPLPYDPLAPPIVRSMLAAGASAGVGPMAAVAGAVAEFVGREMLAAGIEEAVVENGGDIFLARKSTSVVGIGAGPSPLSGKVGISIPLVRMPLGVCTSSGTVGHSLSFGNADAVVVLANDTALADAAATAVGNAVRGERLEPALEVARTIDGIHGVVIIRGGVLAAWGEVELIRL